MSDLRTRIVDAIRINGPMPVSLYMLMCLHDPREGYYATRPALNTDFTTAPETSQVFGELIGLWAAHEWIALGKPTPFHLIELGPGRGVMMADALRAAASVSGFLDAAIVCLVEASPALMTEQAERLARYNPRHFEDLDAIPPGPSIVLANEFLDCLAIRQFLRDGHGWRERQIGVNQSDELIFGIGPHAELPDHVVAMGDGVEVAPALESFTDAIARRFQSHPGRALVIDYGPVDHAPTDTLRAYKAGRQISPLGYPGASDLTADVDFMRLKRLGEASGLIVHGPTTQQHFLVRLGARQRMENLQRVNPDRANDIRAAVEKLVSPNEMGTRFKVIVLAPPNSPPPPGF